MKKLLTVQLKSLSFLKTLSRANSLIANNNVRSVILEIKKLRTKY